MKLLFIPALVLMVSCNKNQVKTFGEYMKWLNNAENGLVKEKYVNGIELKVKFLPAEYLAFREVSNEKQYTKMQRDSILDLYKNSISFLLSIGPDEREEKGGDIMYHDITTYKEYTQRVYDMNFFMGDHVVLKAGEKEYRPVLTQMENIYGLDSKRNIIIVFTPSEKTDQSLIKENLEFRYEDEEFRLGTNYFQFRNKDIKEIPPITFWNS